MPAQGRMGNPSINRARGVLTELARRRADLVPHARGSLHQHLVGVHAILEGWRQPPHVRLAGLLHSGYSTEAFDYRLFQRSERPRVRELVGADAERLVYAFSGCPRDALLAAARAVHETTTLSTRWRNERVTLSARDLSDLMKIHVANLAEQMSRPRGSPDRWLATASDLIAAMPVADRDLPPLFGGANDGITRQEETALLATYRALLKGALPANRSLLRTCPVGEPLVIAGLLLLVADHSANAAELASLALARFDLWATPWDKRLSLGRWRDIARSLSRSAASRNDELAYARQTITSVLEHSRASPARLWAELESRGGFAATGPLETTAAETASPASVATASLPPRFAEYIRGLSTNAERPMMQFYPGLRALPWHDPRQFPIVEDLERLAGDIATEALAFDTRTFQDEAERIGRSGRWSVLFLLEMGRPNADNLARSPTLRGIIEKHRTLTTHAGLMYLSCLDPHTRIAPHHGPTNLRVRCHLGLEIPDACGIRVGGIVERWEEGRCLVLDDSFLHDAWNDSDKRRVVLVLDLWHPDLSDEEVELLSGLHRYGAANGSGARRYWARNDEAKERATAAARSSGEKDVVKELDRLIGATMRSGDLPAASEHAATYAALCRGTRYFPTRLPADPPLPASVPWSPVLTPSKLVHDIEQLQYLAARGILTTESKPIVADYEDLLDTLRPLGKDARVPLVGAALARVGGVYNRLLHVRTTPRVPRALSKSWDATQVETAYEDSRPSVVVVDDFLSKDALESLRQFCLESTIWSTNRYDHGRLGSFFRDGFNCPLLVQIAEELRDVFPRVIGTRHPAAQIWGYKYATTQPSLTPHADFAAVNVNFWITPDDANLDPEGGGLVVYDVAAPRDWDFASYNRDGTKIRELLAARNAKTMHIPYRSNRAVIFDSDLFHATPELRFRTGYENQRMNVTFLYGDRLNA